MGYGLAGEYALPVEDNDTPEEMIFDANLQEFAQQIGILCALESNGKLGAHDAYKRIKKLWKDLRKSKRGLGIGQAPEDATDDSEPNA